MHHSRIQHLAIALLVLGFAPAARAISLDVDPVPGLERIAVWSDDTYELPVTLDVGRLLAGATLVSSDMGPMGGPVLLPEHESPLPDDATGSLPDDATGSLPLAPAALGFVAFRRRR